MKNHQSTMGKDQFSITSSDASFNARRKNVFDQLNSITNTMKDNTLQEDEEKDTVIEHTNYDMQEYRGKKSIFKKPNRPIEKCLPIKKVPDHRVNPNKWVKYSLNDVSEADMSERSNTAAAMSFLREIETRKSEQMEEDDINDASNQKITFRKSVSLKQKLIGESGSDSKTFRNSKVIMPEYVVGQKIKKDKKSKEKRAPGLSSKQLKLDHLLDEENSE